MFNAGVSLGGNPESNIYHVEYADSDKEQINRATVGQGTIIIRSNPDQGLEGLNRDLRKAQELTKDENTSVVVYVDTAFLKEAASGFKGTIEGIKQLGEEAQQLVREWKAFTAALPDDVKYLGQTGLDAMKGMYRNGASEEYVLALMNDSQFQEFLTGFASVDQKHPATVSGVGSVDEQGRIRIDVYPETTPLTRPLALWTEFYNYLKTLPGAEYVQTAIFGIQTIAGGSIKVLENLIAGQVISEALDPLANYITREHLYVKTEDQIKQFGEEDPAFAEKFESDQEAIKFGLELVAGGAVGTIAKKIVRAPHIETGEPIKTILGKYGEFGIKGTKGIESKTIKIFKNGNQLHIENPNKRAGNIHYQIFEGEDRGSYYFNPSTNFFYQKIDGLFYPISKTKNKNFLNIPGMQEALHKALIKLGER